MRRDAADDLVSAPLGAGARDRDVFSRECWERLAAGQHAYTHVHGGGLAHWAWLAEGVQTVTLRDFGEVRFARPTSLVALSPTLATAAGGGLLAASLREMLADAAAGTGDAVHVLAPRGVTVPRALLDELRLTLVGRLVRRARFGRATRSSTAPTVLLPA